MHRLSVINFHRQGSTFVPIDEPTLMHHYPKSMVYITVHTGYYTFYRFEQMDNDMYALL